MSPVQDNRSDQLPEGAFIANISSNTTTFGSAISVADFDLGLKFDVLANNYTDGTYDFRIEESDDVGFSSPSDVATDKIIGLLSALQITAVTAQGDQLNSVGVIGTKAFVRIVIDSTSVTTGADIVVVSNKVAEVSPAVT